MSGSASSPRSANSVVTCRPTARSDGCGAAATPALLATLCDLGGHVARSRVVSTAGGDERTRPPADTGTSTTATPAPAATNDPGSHRSAVENTPTTALSQMTPSPAQVAACATGCSVCAGRRAAGRRHPTISPAREPAP